MTEPHRHKVTSRGDSPAELAVTEWAGDGPTILFVHGYPDTSAVWHPVAALLAGRYHVVAYDVRGAGASSAPGSTEGYRLVHLVADLAAVADAASPERPVHLVGHDWGSIQGWEAVGSDRLAGRIASFTSLYAPGLDHAAAWAAERLRHPTAAPRPPAARPAGAVVVHPRLPPARHHPAVAIGARPPLAVGSAEVGKSRFR